MRPRPSDEAGHRAHGGDGVPRAAWDVLLVVAAGGALGSVARWAVAAAMPSVGGGFPSATFVVNVTGCALIGALMHAEETLWPPARYRRPFLRTGLLGGFTTFSAYGLDTHSLLLAGATVVAVVYVLTSVVGGLLAVRLGAAGAAALAIPVGRLRRPGGTPAAGGEGG